MQRSLLVFLLAISLATLHSAASAADPELTLESILSRLEQMSRDCRSLDVEFTRRDYDAHGRLEQKSQGRFYWEETHLGCMKLNDDWLIWDDAGSRQIDTANRTVREIPAALLARARRELAIRDDESAAEGFFASLARAIVVCTVAAAPPDELLMTTHFNAAELQERFELRWEIREENIFLAATPKKQSDALWYRELDLLIDRTSFHVIGAFAKKSGGSACSFVFEHARVNETPADRTDLLWPKLNGYETWRIK
jgi:hypothetical protein